MKLTVEKQGKIVKVIKAEYTPTEALVIHHAMTRYFWDKEVNATDRGIMWQMLDVEPIFVNVEEEQEPILDKIRAEIIDLSEGWNGMQSKNVPLGAVLKVIDKYTSGKKE